jgi:predicted nucleotidyltransferase
MSREDVLSILREYKKQRRHQHGIVKLGIFGSTARGEDSQDSDVDVVIVFEKPDLFDMAGVKRDLEEMIHKTVDIVSYRENMNNFLKQHIDKEAVYV